MDSTPYQRLEEFWLFKGLKNMSAFAEAIKRSPGTISALKVRGSAPGTKLMQVIQRAFPDLNPDYILWGEGSMLRGNKELKPFFPLGQVDSQGNTIMPGEGSIAATGFNLSDTEPDKEPAKESAPSVKTANDLIKKIMQEADEARKEIKALKEERTQHLRIIERLQQSNEFLETELREARAELRGKEIGNQPDAPGQSYETPRAQVGGLRRYDEETQCVIRPLWAYLPANEVPALLQA